MGSYIRSKVSSSPLLLHLNLRVGAMSSDTPGIQRSDPVRQTRRSGSSLSSPAAFREEVVVVHDPLAIRAFLRYRSTRGLFSICHIF